MKSAKHTKYEGNPRHAKGLQILSDREYKRLAKRAASMALAAAMAASTLCAPALAYNYTIDETHGTVHTASTDEGILSWQEIIKDGLETISGKFNHTISKDNTINISGGTTTDQVLNVGSGTTGVDGNESLDINIDGVDAEVEEGSVVDIADGAKVDVEIKDSHLTTNDNDEAAIRVGSGSKVTLSDNTSVTNKSGTGVQVENNATLIINGAEVQAGTLILSPVEIPADIEMNGGNLELNADACKNTQESGDGLTVEVNGDSNAHLSEGTYNDLQFTVNDSMLTVEYEGDVTMQGSANEYAVSVNVGTEEGDSEGTTGVTFKAAEPAQETLENPEGPAEEDGLTISGYTNGVRTESKKVEIDGKEVPVKGDVEINFQEGSNVTITDSQHNGSGTTGNAIYVGHNGQTTINIGSDDEKGSDDQRVTQPETEYETKVDLSDNGHSGIYACNSNAGDKDNILIVNVNSSEVHVDDNDYSGVYGEGSNNTGITITIKDSFFTASRNGDPDKKIDGSGIAFSSGSVKKAVFNATHSYIELNENNANGINRGYLTITDSTVVSNNNRDCNIQAYSLHMDNSSLTANEAKIESGIRLKPIDQVSGVDCSRPSAEDYSLKVENGSTIVANNNKENGLRMSYDGLIDSSSVILQGNKDNAIKFVRDGNDTKDGNLVERKLVVDGASVVVLKDNAWDVLGDDANQLFVVKSGSVQLNPLKVSMGENINKAFDLDGYLSGKDFNGQKNDQFYLAPINEDGTMLTPFKLSDLKENGELTQLEDGTWQFTYCDPNTGEEHTYTFRYNTAGEDLDNGIGGDAYIWVPVSVVKYDATQGSVDTENLGTAQLDKNGKYAYDMTIFGHSLSMIGKQLATAVADKDTPDGYTFQGWYVQFKDGTVVDIPAESASWTQEDWDAFYEQLNQEFGEDSLVGNYLSAGQKNNETLTIYAKWAAAPSGGGEETPTDPTPDPDDEPELILTDVPTEEELPEEETPLAPAPEEEIVEEETPLVDAPVIDESLEEVIEELGEEEVPLASAPKTGDESGVWMLLSAFSGMALAVLSFIDRKGRHARFGAKH